MRAGVCTIGLQSLEVAPFLQTGHAGSVAV
jgi:hypothetical protein